MFTFKNDDEVASLQSAIDRDGFISIFNYDSFLDQKLYSEVMCSYMEDKRSNSNDYSIIKSRRPRRIPRSLAIGDKSPYTLSHFNAVVHMLSIPIVEVPLYLTSSYALVVRVTKWRLSVGR